MRVVLGLLAFCALGLTACFEGDSDAPDAVASATPGETATANALDPTTTSAPASTADVSRTREATVTATTSVATPSPVRTPTPVLASAWRPSPTFDRPIEALAYDSGVLVADQGGVVTLIREGGAPVVMLDLTDRVSRDGNEEGLLSIALDPLFDSNGRLWAYYSAASGTRRTVLSSFQLSANGLTFNAGSETVVLEQAQPFPNHNGGAIRFGPEGMLYLGLGDGGSGGDPQGNGQSLTTILGKIIRVDVSTSTSESPYRIPPTNPYPHGGGGIRGEIWALGLRNPWRMAFDRATGALWVGDVGQGAVEEVSVVTSGANMGWSIMEGDTCYEASTCQQAGLIPPVATYQHTGGRCSISAGIVARNVAVRSLEGSFLYADFCTGELWALPVAGGDPVMIASGLGNVTTIAQVGSRLFVLAFGSPLLELRDGD